MSTYSLIAQALIVGVLADMEGTLEAQEKKRRILAEDEGRDPRASLTRYNTRCRHWHDENAAEAIRAERLARKRAAFEKRQPSNTTPAKGTP